MNSVPMYMLIHGLIVITIYTYLASKSSDALDIKVEKVRNTYSDIFEGYNWSFDLIAPYLKNNRGVRIERFIYNNFYQYSPYGYHDFIFYKCLYNLVLSLIFDAFSSWFLFILLGQIFQSDYHIVSFHLMIIFLPVFKLWIPYIKKLGTDEDTNEYLISFKKAVFRIDQAYLEYKISKNAEANQHTYGLDVLK